MLIGKVNVVALRPVYELQPHCSYQVIASQYTELVPLFSPLTLNLPVALEFGNIQTLLFHELVCCTDWQS